MVTQPVQKRKIMLEGEVGFQSGESDLYKQNLPVAFVRLMAIKLGVSNSIEGSIDCSILPSNGG